LFILNHIGTQEIYKFLFCAEYFISQIFEILVLSHTLSEECFHLTYLRSDISTPQLLGCVNPWLVHSLINSSKGLNFRNREHLMVVLPLKWRDVNVSRRTFGDWQGGSSGGASAYQA
jgi:hypothetical protein